MANSDKVAAIFKLVPMTRVEFSAAIGVSDSKLEAWLGGRVGYREPTPEELKRARTVLRRHVADASALLGETEAPPSRPAPAAPPVLKGSAAELVRVVHLLPWKRGALAERLGVSRSRLDSWLSGDGRARPPSADVVRRARRMFASYAKAVESIKLEVLGAPWEWDDDAV